MRPQLAGVGELRITGVTQASQRGEGSEAYHARMARQKAALSAD
jgi:hypothetical protein